MRALITAAGFGTRMLPLTKSIPKEMLPVGDKPAIHYVVEELIENGINDIIIVVGENGDVTRNYFKYSLELEKHLKSAGMVYQSHRMDEINSMANIRCVEQLPMSAGHGNVMPILSARHLLKDEPFVLMWGDIIATSSRLDRALARFYKNDSKYSILCATRKVEQSDFHKYGYIQGHKYTSAKHKKKGDFRVDSMLEKPEIGTEVHSGYAVLNGYIFTPKIFEILDGDAPDHEEKRITDYLNLLIKEEPVYAVDVSDIAQFDVGTLEGYRETLIKFLT